MKFPPPFYRWRPHPWHGLDAGKDPPRVVHAYIEITPFDVIKYEVDKTTGYMRVDSRSAVHHSRRRSTASSRAHTATAAPRRCSVRAG